MPEKYDNTCPMPQKDLINEYFMEYRAQLIDVAAFLDRMERSVEKNGEDDFRFKALLAAINILASGESLRVERMQMVLSDADTRLLEERDSVSASGAVNSGEERKREITEESNEAVKEASPEAGD